MKKFLKFVGLKPSSDDMMELVVSLGATVDSNLEHLKKIDENQYCVDDVLIEVTWFDVTAFDEVRISYGYGVNKGLIVALRNYIEHIVVMNHEIQDTTYALTWKVPTESFVFGHYRKTLDTYAENIIKSILAYEAAPKAE